MLPMHGAVIPNRKHHCSSAFQTYGTLLDSRGCIPTTKTIQENNLGMMGVLITLNKISTFPKKFETTQLIFDTNFE